MCKPPHSPFPSWSVGYLVASQLYAIWSSMLYLASQSARRVFLLSGLLGPILLMKFSYLAFQGPSKSVLRSSQPSTAWRCETIKLQFRLFYFLVPFGFVQFISDPQSSRHVARCCKRLMVIVWLPPCFVSILWLNALNNNLFFNLDVKLDFNWLF